MSENNDLLDPTFSNPNYANSNGVLPNATATLVLGICSIVGCFLYGIPGLICGIIAIVLNVKDKKVYDTNPPFYAGSWKNAKAGKVCAVIGLSLSAVYIVVLLIAFYVAFSIGSKF